jgi:hypothetical protein
MSRLQRFKSRLLKLTNEETIFQIELKYYAGQKILAVIVCQLKKKKIVIRTLLSS